MDHTSLSSQAPPLLLKNYKKGWKVTADWNWLEWSVVFSILIPAILYLPGTQMFRPLIRVITYALSGFLFIKAVFDSSRLRRSERIWPLIFLIWVFVYMAMMLLHPTTNSFMGGVASILFTTLIWLPLYWGHAWGGDLERAHRVVRVLFIVNLVNAAFGVLQIYDPSWMPSEFSSIFTQSTYGLGTVTYVDALGRNVIRPPGFSDTPGAACMSGMFAVVVGYYFLSGAKQMLTTRVMGALGALMGLMVILLSHVRSSLVVAALACGVLTGVRLAKKNLVGIFLVLFVGGVIVTQSLSWVEGVVGRGTIERYSSLLSFQKTYIDSRGGFLRELDTLILKYPFGSGLGRWGMMSHYFGDRFNRESPPLYAEIQLTGWLYDGGVMLILLYLLAIVTDLTSGLRWALFHPNSEFREFCAITTCLGIGLCALILSYAPFHSQLGLQYWMMSGMRFALKETLDGEG